MIRIDKENNTVVLGSNDELFKEEVICSDIFFTGLAAHRFEGKKLKAKIRYTARPAECSIKVIDSGEISKDNKKVDDKKIITTFCDPQRAPAPGQSIVYYNGDIVVGGGFIV